jgi:hypothetical protein
LMNSSHPTLGAVRAPAAAIVRRYMPILNRLEVA